MERKKSIVISDQDLRQGSKEWVIQRGKGIGSSEIGTILGVNPYKDAFQLWMEKTGQVESEDISNKYAVKRGQALEPFARNIYNDRVQKEFIPATFIHPDYDFMRYSSDGWNEETSEIIEIKCLMKTNHEKFMSTGDIPPSYFYQMQWGLMVAGCETCHFLAYNPSYEEPLLVKTIHADKDEHQNMIDAAIKFWHCVQNKIDPTL